MAGLPAIAAGRLAAGGAAIVAASVLADSGTEHYRGSFSNPAMPLPIAASALSLAADGALAAGMSGASRSPLVMSIHAASALTGAAGLGFHAYNITRKTGGLRWGNIFYHAPIGAPAALVLAGALGAAGQALLGGSKAFGSNWLRSGRALAGVTSIGLAGTAGEAALLHFRGAYHNPAMWLPVTIAPVSALAMAKAAITGRTGGFALLPLAMTAALGLAGAAFHAYGISRNMGGWRNWRQNLLAGPPLPAPPSFTGLAIAGLGALLLVRSAVRG